MTVACEVCSRSCEIPPSRLRTFHTCSHACAAIRKSGGPPSRERTCRECGKTEIVKASQSDRPFCSRKCYAESLKRSWSKTPTHGSWRSMIRRCTEPTNKRWKHYGGRGITVCQRWLESFEAFLADMGERPDGCSIDRIDPDGNYEPGNCRWATIVEQRHNRRDSRQSKCDWPEIEEELR